MESRDMEQSKRIGRPPKEPGEKKRQSLSLRIRDAVKDRLVEAARVSGLSISEELERRVERSFEASDLFVEAVGGPEIADYLRLWALVARRTAMSSGMEDQKLQILASIIRICEIQADMDA